MNWIIIASILFRLIIDGSRIYRKLTYIPEILILHDFKLNQFLFSVYLARESFDNVQFGKLYHLWQWLRAVKISILRRQPDDINKSIKEQFFIPRSQGICNASTGHLLIIPLINCCDWKAPVANKVCMPWCMYELEVLFDSTLNRWWTIVTDIQFLV